MTHKIIKTENYLLVVDDSEVNINQYVYCDLGYIEKVMDIIDGWIYHTNTLGKNPIKHYKKITAHLPLNNSPVLEFVPLLPLLEDDNKEVWDQGLAAELEKLPYTKHLDDGQYNDGQLAGFEFGATWGYNKAKEKYRFTEEDMRKAVAEAVVRRHVKGDILISQIIQSLSQPKMPVGFECEVRPYTVGEMSKLPLGTRNEKIKTTTNPQGQTVLVGKYIY